MIKERKTFITKLYIVKFDCFLYKNYILVFETIQYAKPGILISLNSLCLYLGQVITDDNMF